MFHFVFAWQVSGNMNSLWVFGLYTHQELMGVKYSYFVLGLVHTVKGKKMELGSRPSRGHLAGLDFVGPG